MSAVLKNLPVKDLVAGVYLSDTHPPPRILFGAAVKQFCKFGIWSKGAGKLNQ
jgi:hypothetical protein